MTTTAKKISGKQKYFPSINIIRDSQADLNYIPTPNSIQAFNQIVGDYKIGVKAFTLVGAYGTGKSAFLWAFDKTIKRDRQYFGDRKIFNSSKGFNTVKVIGEYSSIIDVFAKQFGVKNSTSTKPSDVIQHVEKQYLASIKQGQALVIIIDEFGKFLEFASKNDPERELYFIQQLAEYVNDESKDILLLTTLHQDFNGYSRNLTKPQRDEWDKVKGRLKEITFNEPVEQLLLLASERLKELGQSSYTDINFERVFKAIAQAKLFPLKDFFNEEFATNLLPFDILSASILTLSLQKYGQNERSLFSFIESNDRFGLKEFNPKESPYYNLAWVYDYLFQNYYSFLNTKYNPHYTQWVAIKVALEKADGLFEENGNDAYKILKTIGLLSIFAHGASSIDKEFLTQYGKFSLGIKEPEKVIKSLEGLRIIRFIKHSQRYILFEGTDLDIELAIDDAGNLIEQVSGVVSYLNKYFDFPYIAAKAIYYRSGTPRFFGFQLSEAPIEIQPEGEIDGYINLIFSDNIRENDVKLASKTCDEAILFGYYKNTSEIKKLIFEIEKVKKVKELNPDDKVAVRELDAIYQHQIKLLNHYVIGNLYSLNSPISWYFKGKEIEVKSAKKFNRLLSSICEDVYPQTPEYRNEMVNKTKLSNQIATARKNFVKAMVDNWSEKDWAFEDSKFPPEKTIYLSLVRETGIHRKDSGSYTLTEPSNKSFLPIWNAGDTFLESTKEGKRSVQDFVDILLTKPFKLKQGFIDFWLPLFLFIRRDEFAIFSKDGFIPVITEQTFDLIVKDPGDFEIKAFDIEGVKLNIFNSYRSILNQSEKDKFSTKSFIETIRPFLVFYRDLPEYVKNTKRLSKKALKLRDAIAFSKDPELTFFNDFPTAMGYTVAQLQKDKTQLVKYVEELQLGLKEIRTFYDGLLDRFEGYICEDIIGSKLDFVGYKEELKSRFKRLKKHLLLPYQKVFYQRINSELDDRKAWLNSIAQAVIGKSLEMISDEDEDVLYEKLRDVIHELDNLCDISKSGFDENKEIAFKLEVTSFVEGLKKNLVRLPKSKNTQLLQLHSVVKAKLSNDKQLNIATLAKLLEDLLKDEK